MIQDLEFRARVYDISSRAQGLGFRLDIYRLGFELWCQVINIAHQLFCARCSRGVVLGQLLRCEALGLRV
jgi:hypothetical protein